MAAQIKMGGFLALILWMSICAGIGIGAGVGFNADSAENASMSFDPETGEFVAGENVTNVYDHENNSDTETNSSEDLEKFEEWLDEVNENAEDIQLVPGAAGERLDAEMEAFSENLAHGLLELSYDAIVTVGDPVAGWTYENQDRPLVSEELFIAVSQLLLIAPFLLAGYAFLRRVVR